MRRLLLLTAMTTVLAACGAKNSGTATTPQADAPVQTPSVAPTAPTTAELKQQATATQESAGADEAAGDPALERVTALPAKLQLPAGRWKAEVNYKPIVPAQATSAEPGEVEVIEFMWLGCHHCADLNPTIEAWAKQKPAYIKFVQQHVMWGTLHRAHGRLLYTLQALHREDLVQKAFDEIHVRQQTLFSPKGDDAETLAMQLAFARANGVNEADFKREYNSFGVTTALQRAEELNRRYRIESVPTIIINGKYSTAVDMAGGKQQLIQLITDLAAFEKGR
jgi:thiol:disulfide interchange protein DsbA